MTETTSSPAPGGPPAPAEAAPANNAKGRKRIALLVLAILATAGGIAYWLLTRAYETTDDAFIEGHIVQLAPQVPGIVKAVYVRDNQDVKKGDLLVEIDDRDYQQRLAQAEAALAAAQARERSAKVNVELTKTTAGADLEAASAGLRIAESAVIGARAQVAVARSQQAQVEAKVATATAALEQAQADSVASGAEATRADADVKRYDQLFKEGSTTAQQHDNAVAAAVAASAKLQSARKKIVAADAQVKEAQAGVKSAAEAVKQAQTALAQAEAGVVQAQARVAQVNIVQPRTQTSEIAQQTAAIDITQLRANVELAKLQLSYTKILAPRDGRITRKSVEPGAFVQPGQVLGALVPAEVWVIANFKETQLEDMRVGQDVTIKIDAYPGRTFRGKVQSIMRGAGARFSLLPPENATGNYVKVVQRVPVKIVFDDPDVNAHEITLGPGMSVVPKVKVR